MIFIATETHLAPRPSLTMKGTFPRQCYTPINFVANSTGVRAIILFLSLHYGSPLPLSTSLCFAPSIHPILMLHSRKEQSNAGIVSVFKCAWYTRNINKQNTKLYLLVNRAIPSLLFGRELFHLAVSRLSLHRCNRSSLFTIPRSRQFYKSR